MIEPTKKERKAGEAFIVEWGSVNQERGRALRPWPDVAYAFGLAANRARAESTEDDLAACRAAYAHVCEAVTPGYGPGGAAAVAICVEILRKRKKEAEAQVGLLGSALTELIEIERVLTAEGSSVRTVRADAAFAQARTVLAGVNNV